MLKLLTYCEICNSNECNEIHQKEAEKTEKEGGGKSKHKAHTRNIYACLINAFVQQSLHFIAYTFINNEQRIHAVSK